MTEPKHFTQRDLDAMEPRYRAQFVNSLAGFKSANLIGSIDGDGFPNLAMVSSVIHLGAQPPLMGMVTRPRTVERHSVENIVATGFYTLNHVHAGMLEAAHQTSARYPRGQSEFAATGLTPVYGRAQPAPYVAESHLSIGLRLREIKPIELNNTEFIIGEIIEVRLDKRALEDDGFVNLETLGTLTVSGLDSYHKTHSLGRMAYAKPDRPPGFLNTGAKD